MLVCRVRRARPLAGGLSVVQGTLHSVGPERPEKAPLGTGHRAGPLVPAGRGQRGRGASSARGCKAAPPGGGVRGPWVLGNRTAVCPVLPLFGPRDSSVLWVREWGFLHASRRARGLLWEVGLSGPQPPWGQPLGQPLHLLLSHWPFPHVSMACVSLASEGHRVGCDRHPKSRVSSEEPSPFFWLRGPLERATDAELTEHLLLRMLPRILILPSLRAVYFALGSIVADV